MPILTRPHLTLTTLLLASCMTVMAGAIIAPSLPGIAAHFATTPNAALLARLVLVLPALTIVIAAPIAGWLADRYGSRIIIIGGATIFVVGGASGAVLNSLVAIVAGRLVLGLGVAALMVGGTTAIAAFFADRRAAVLGFQSAAAAGGGVLFLTGGGWLADIDWRAPFYIYLTAAAIIPLVLVAIPPADTGAVKNAGSDAAILPLARLLPIYAMAFVIMIGFYLIPGQVPFLVEAESLGTATGAGVAIASSTLTSAIVALFYGRLAAKISRPALLVATFTTLGIGLLGAAVAPSLAVLIGAMALTGIGMGMFQPTAMSIILERVADTQAGRATSGFTSSLFLGRFCSAFVASLIPGASAATPFLAVGTALLVATEFAVLISWVVRAHPVRSASQSQE